MWHIERMWGIVVFVAMWTVVGTAIAQVDCNAGATITEAVASASPGDTIQVTGTCNESVTITTDRLTLDGQGSAVIDGGGGGEPGDISQGVITINGARGVVITGFTVQNAPIDGIAILQGGAATIQNIITQDSADEGIVVTEGSTAELTDCTALRNGDFGIAVVHNSQIIMRGTNVSNENVAQGILILNSSSIAVDNGTLQTNMNGAEGVLIGASSFSLAPRIASTLTSNNNRLAGVFVFNGGNFNAGSGTITVAMNGGDGIFLFNGGTLNAASSTITATMNGRDGIQVSTGSSFSVGEAATLSLETNGRAGLTVIHTSQILAFASEQGPLSIGGNTGPGVSVVNASVTLTGATIQNNGPPDINLDFGARTNFSNSTIAGMIACDGTELLIGATCSP